MQKLIPCESTFSFGLMLTGQQGAPHHSNTADCVQNMAIYQESILMEAHYAIHHHTNIRHNTHINKALEDIDCRDHCEKLGYLCSLAWPDNH